MHKCLERIVLWHSLFPVLGNWFYVTLLFYAGRPINRCTLEKSQIPVFNLWFVNRKMMFYSNYAQNNNVIGYRSFDRVCASVTELLLFSKHKSQDTRALKPSAWKTRRIRQLFHPLSTYSYTRTHKRVNVRGVGCPEPILIINQKSIKFIVAARDLQYIILFYIPYTII